MYLDQLVYDGVENLNTANLLQKGLLLCPACRFALDQRSKIPQTGTSEKRRSNKRQARLALPWQWAVQSPANAGVVSVLSTQAAWQFAHTVKPHEPPPLPIFTAFASRTGSSLHVSAGAQTSQVLNFRLTKTVLHFRVSSEEERSDFIKVQYLSPFLGVNLAWQTPVGQPCIFLFFFLSIFVTDFSLPTGQNDPFRCSGICCVL